MKETATHTHTHTHTHTRWVGEHAKVIRVLDMLREEDPESSAARKELDKTNKKYQGLLHKQEQLLRGNPATT